MESTLYFLFGFILIKQFICSPPPFVKVGVITAMYTQDWESDTGTQYLAAIRMAINEINHSKDLLPSTKIKFAFLDSKLNAGTAFFTSLNMASKVFNQTGVDAVLGPETSSESINSALVLKTFGIPQISMSATSPQLSSKKDYPYFARTCPSDAFQGKAMAELVHHYGWKRVTTFANSDAYGSAGIQSFQQAAAKLDITIIQSFLFPLGQSNFDKIISSVKESSARIFIFFADTHDVAQLLQQGYAKGLFGENTQLIGSDSVTTSTTYDEIPLAIRDNIMKGFIGTSLYTNLTSSKGITFMEKFRSLSRTDGTNGAIDNCNQEKDDNGNYLWKEYDSESNLFYCGGNDYSTFELDGSGMDSFVPYAYDSMYALAMAMHEQLYIQGSPQIDGARLFDTLIANVSFVGVSGLLSFAKATTDDETRFHEGDRETGVQYAFSNYQPGKVGFQTVGTWNPEGGVSMCNAATIGDCPVVFNTPSGSPPSDSPADISHEMGQAMKVILMLFGSIVLILSVTLLILVGKYRKKKIIRLSQISMITLMLMGGVIAGIYVILTAMPYSVPICSVNIWLPHFALWLLLSTLAVKTWRIYRLLNAGMKRIRITENDVLKIVAGVMLVVCFLLAIVHGGGDPYIRTVRTISGIETYRTEVCGLKNANFQTALFAIDAAGVAFVLRICWMAKDMPDAVNESKFIFFAIGIICIISALVFPIVYLINLDIIIRLFIASMAYALAAILSLLIIFAPKVHSVFFEKEDINRMSSMSGKFTTHVEVVSRPPDEGRGSVAVDTRNSVVAFNARKSLMESQPDNGDEKAEKAQITAPAPLPAVPLQAIPVNSNVSSKGFGRVGSKDLTKLQKQPVELESAGRTFKNADPVERIKICESQIKNWEKALQSSRAEILRANMALDATIYEPENADDENINEKSDSDRAKNIGILGKMASINRFFGAGANRRLSS